MDYEFPRIECLDDVQQIVIANVKQTIEYYKLNRHEHK